MEAGNQNSNGKGFVKSLRGGLILACVLLLMDGASGNCLFSLSTGPIWFLIGILIGTWRSIRRRGNWRLTLARILLPIVTVALAVGNASLQKSITRHNASEIIVACEHYHAATGEYPYQLEDLVPAYLHSIPRAKYALVMDTFQYFRYQNRHQLGWFDVPFGFHTYDFEKAQWSSGD
jgi:hypothetical protein